MKPKTRGRPRKQLDAALIQKLSGIGCTTAEIAAVTGVSSDTLERNYAADMEKGREVGKSSLRRMQWKAAEGGNTGMMIWLGKQLLQQRDKAEVTGKDGGSIQQETTVTHLTPEQAYAQLLSAGK